MAKRKQQQSDSTDDGDDGPGPSNRPPAAAAAAGVGVGGGAAAGTAAGGMTSIVYIGHLPHGFYEDELLGFFSQFGRLARVRVSRSKKTAKAKHYAFLEFQHPDVAQIAAQTMDGYFLFKQRLSCRVLRAEEVHPQLFKGANRKFKKVPWRKIAAERVNKERTPEEAARRVAALLKRDKQRQKRIAAAGIDYQYEPLAAQQQQKAKKIKFN